MNKIPYIIAFLLFVCSIAAYSNETKSKYQRDVVYGPSGRVVFPPNITVDVDSVDSILAIKIPYLRSLFIRGVNFLFMKMSMLPVNVEYERDLRSKEDEIFFRSDEWRTLLNYVRDYGADLNKKSLKDLLEGDYLQEWGYKCIRGKRSLTLLPKDEIILSSIQVPALNIEEFSYALLLENETILKIMKTNDLNPPIAKSIITHEMYQIQNETFPFKFEGGSLLDYLIHACESCMDYHTDYIIRFKFFPKEGFQTIVTRFQNKYDTLVRFSEYNY